MTRAPRPRRVRQIVLAAVVFVAALEVVLQAGALVVAATTRSRTTDDGAAVVCVGDSYTFGTGATSSAGSYPRQLRDRLREQGLDVDVSNAGMPSRDSAAVLRALPALLRPGTRVLCVMLGTNDGWSHPARVPDADVGATDGTGEGFVLRWRTGRLLALLFRGGATTRGAAAPAPDTSVRPDLVNVDAGFAVLEANGLIPREPRLPVLPPPCPEMLRPRVDEVFRSLQDDGGARARALARELVAQHPDSPDAWRALAQASYGVDEPGVAQALARLEQLAATGEPAAAEAFMMAAFHTGHAEQAKAAARARLAREPAALMAWDVLQQTAFALGDWDEFTRAATEGLALAGRFAPVQSAAVVRNYTRVIAPADARRAAVLVAAATLLDGDVAQTRATLQAIGPGLSRETVEAALAAVTAPPGQVAALRASFMVPPDAAAAWTGVLREHLVRIGHVAQARGVRVVMLGYPFPRPELEAAQRAAAAELGAPFVDVREPFERLLRTRARDELFVRDGHCNDAGYGIVAALVAPIVAGELAR